MTNREAIDILEDIPAHIGPDCDGYELKAIRMAQDALQEQEVVEPENLVPYKNFKGRYIITGSCPVCHSSLVSDYNHYCGLCGRKIDWTGISIEDLIRELSNDRDS